MSCYLPQINRLDKAQAEVRTCTDSHEWQVSYFDSTALFGSYQRLTLGNIIDGWDVPFLGTVAAMEIYIGITKGVPGPVKKEIMKSLCRDYRVDIDQGDQLPMCRYDHRTWVLLH